MLILDIFKNEIRNWKIFLTNNHNSIATSLWFTGEVCKLVLTEEEKIGKKEVTLIELLKRIKYKVKENL